MGGNGKEKEGVEGEGKEEKRGRRGEGVHVHVALYPMWSAYEAGGGGWRKDGPTILNTQLCIGIPPFLSVFNRRVHVSDGSHFLPISHIFCT